MSFEVIENMNPSPAKEVTPVDGLRIYARTAPARKGSTKPGTYYMTVQLGLGLARRLAFHKDQHNVQILLGTGRDAGKMQIALDQTAGQFYARKRKIGQYCVTIKGASMDGLFARAFPPLIIAHVETVKSEASGQVCCTFPVSPEMLRVEGDD